MSSSDGSVKAQYEALPYPTRDPRDEKKRLISGSPSHPFEVEHFVYGGHIPRDRRFRILVAGGGTGDALILLAQITLVMGIDAELVYVDQSQASRRIAEERAKVRELDNIQFVTGSLLDVAEMGIGTFDYIDCCGVLHHLADPDAGLRALASVLNPLGGIGIMLYGRLGRSGIYEMQEILRAVAGEESGSHKERAAVARRVLKGLPATNWFRKNTTVTDHLTDDAGIFDLLLHPRDRAYSVPEVYDFADQAGLRVQSFLEPARYDPRTYLTDVLVAKRLAELDAPGQAALAEMIAGNLQRHVVYLVRQDNPVAIPQPTDLSWVPVFKDMTADALIGAIGPERMMKAVIDGLSLRMPLPALTAPISRLADGKRTLAEILEKVRTDGRADLTEERFMREFEALYRPLFGMTRMLLRKPVEAKPISIGSGGLASSLFRSK